MFPVIPTMPGQPLKEGKTTRNLNPPPTTPRPSVTPPAQPIPYVPSTSISPIPFPVESVIDVKRIVVNKRTHRIRFENETEYEVTIVIDHKDES